MLKHTVASMANLIGDTTRSAMLIALLDGRALTAGELARQANISPQTASSHLNKLVEGDLVSVEVQGRHRYYCLTKTEVAHALEALALLSSSSLKDKTVKPLKEIHYARSCYDHLAGRLGVVMTEAFVKQKFITRIENDYHLTSIGEKQFVDLGIDIKDVMSKRRRFAYPCLDWSERLHHLAGSLGAALLNLLLQKRWVLRAKQGRVLHLTPEGKRKLNELFKLGFF